MYSSISKGIALLIVILINSLICSANAEQKPILSTNIEFSVQPQQCVTLRQGRDCYATITIQWQKPIAQPLCLYQLNTNQANGQKQLQCWPSANNGQTKIEFVSSDNLTYQLRTLQGKQLIAEAEIVVSWVHKNTSRKRRWRLF